MSSTCCFTGHRQISHGELETIKKQTEAKVSELINNGVDTFMAGGALGFDTVAALTVLKLKLGHPEIKLILALPCREQTKFWKPEDIETYEKINEMADEVACLSERYTRSCMFARNRYMVDNSDFVIAYCKKQTGGSAYTVEYAKKHGKTVILL